MNKAFQRVVAAHFFMGKKCCHHHFPSIFIPKRIKKGLYFGYTFLLAQHIHRMRMLSFFVQSLLLIPSLQLVGRRSARHPQPFRIGQTCNGTVFFQISLQQRSTLLLATLFHRRQEAELGTEDVCFLPHPLHQFRHRTEVHLLYPHGCRTYLLPVCHLTRGQGKRKRTQAVQPHIFSLPQMGYNHIYRPPPVALPPHSPPNMRYAWTTPSLCDR